MSTALKRLVLQTRRQQLHPRPAVGGTTTVFVPPTQQGGRGIDNHGSIALSDTRGSSTAYYPFPTIHHFNLALAEAVRDQRWSDVGILEEGLAPFCEAHSAANRGETSCALPPPELEYDGTAPDSLAPQNNHPSSMGKEQIRPSAETFQLLMAGRLQLGDWCGALSYFSDSQNELLPVADATIRMALRALRCASPHAMWSTAVTLFRSYQHRVNSADTTDILFDVLIDAGKYEIVEKLYEETKDTLPLEGSILAIAESARHTGNWVLATRLAAAAVGSPLPSATSSALVGCGLGALLDSGRYRDVLSACQRPILAALLDEDALLVAARAAVALRHVPAVLDVVDTLEHRGATLDAQRDACNMALLTLHHCAHALAVSEHPTSAVRAVLRMAHAQQLKSNAHRGKWSTGGNWLGGLLTIASLRNVDAISVLDTVVLMEPLHKWDAALSVLVHAHSEFLLWKELDTNARTGTSVRHRPKHLLPPWVASPVTAWAVERVLASFPPTTSHHIQRVAFLRSAVDLGWVSAPLAAIFLEEAASASPQTGFLEHLDGRWLFNVLQDSTHVMGKCLRDLERLVNVSAENCEADAAIVSLAEVVMSASGPEPKAGWRASLAKELVRLVQRPTQRLSPISADVLQLLERRLVPWLLTQDMRAHALALLGTTSERWSTGGASDGHAGQHLDEIGDTIVSKRLLADTHLVVMCDTMLSIVSKLLRAYIHAGRSDPFARTLASVLPFRSDPRVADELHALVLCFLEHQQRTGADLSILAAVTAHLMQDAMKGNEKSPLSSLLERMVIHDITTNPNRLEDYFSSRVGVMWMRRQWKASTVPRLAFLHTAVQAIHDHVSESTAYECLRMHTTVATNTTEDVEAVTNLLGCWVVAWSRTTEPRGGPTDKVLELLALGRTIPLPSLLVRAHTNTQRRTPASASLKLLETAHRVLLTWHLEGRAIPMVQQPGVLALPSSLSGFASMVKSLDLERSECLSSSQFVRASMHVMETSPDRRINAVRLCHALMSTGSKVMRDPLVAAQAIQLAASIPPELKHDVAEVGESHVWKLLVSFPHVIQKIPFTSLVGRVLVANALRQRPLVLWQAALEWLHAALRDVPAISVHERRDALAIIGALAPKYAASPIVQQLHQRIASLPDVHGGEEAWVSVLHSLRGRPISTDDLPGLPWDRAREISPDLKQTLQQAACDVLRAGTSTFPAVEIALMVLMHTSAPVPDVPTSLYPLVWAVVASWVQRESLCISIEFVITFLPKTVLLGAIAANAGACFQIRSFVNQRKEAALANLVMDIVVGSSFGTWVVTGSPLDRSAITSACIYLGRWRELSSIANRWLASSSIQDPLGGVQQPSSKGEAAVLSTPAACYLLRIIAASWQTQGNLLVHAPTQRIATDVANAWLQAIGDSQHVLHVSEMIALCQRELLASRRPTGAMPDPLEVVQRTALRYIERAPTLRTQVTDGCCWRAALGSILDGSMALLDGNVSELLRAVSDGSSGCVTALHILENLRAPHVPNRVPLRLCEEAIAASPTWVEAVRLTVVSVASLNGAPPSATQRYLMFLTLERMRKALWSEDGRPILKWDIASALLQLTTAGNYQRLPQRAFVEVLRHSYANPNRTMELYRCFQLNNYPRLEGVNHLLSLLRSARWNRRLDLLELAKAEFVVQSRNLSSNNRCKMLKELSQVAHSLMTADHRSRFCESIRSSVQLSEAEDLLLL